MKRLLVFTLCLITWTGSAAPAVPPRDEEGQIRKLLNVWEKAFRARDVEAVMACYAPGGEVVAFDIVAPLSRVGRDAYRKNYEEFFGMYEGPLEVEFRDLKIVAAGDVAFLTALERMSGVLKGSERSDLWCRVTSGLRKLDGKWLIVHDHVSVPVDVQSGKALLDLKP